MTQPDNSIEYCYTGARVLVTGGTSGIGYAIATAFADAGATVTVTGTRPAATDYDCELSRFAYRQLQVEDRAQVDAVAAGLDGLDILVNNAGAVWPGGRSEYEPETFERAIRINLLAGYNMSHACREKLAASTLRGGSSIIGIASLSSYFAVAVVPGYGAAKAALVQLAKTLATEWADDGIRVNNVAAGHTITRMTGHMPDDEQANASVIGRTPLKRWGEPEEIAAAVLFLASAQASFVTGETLIVDGGYSVVG